MTDKIYCGDSNSHKYRLLRITRLPKGAFQSIGNIEYSKNSCTINNARKKRYTCSKKSLQDFIHFPKKKKEILQYEDKVYITFEDNVTEIELRYKRKRKRY